MTQPSPAGPLSPASVERFTDPAVLRQFLAGLEARLGPTDRAGLHRRANLLRGLGHGAAAASTYRTLLALDPQDQVAQAGLAIFTGAPLVTAVDRPTPFVQIHNALAPAQQDRLWQTLAEQTARLQPARIYQDGGQQIDATRRVAQRLDQADAVRAWFLPWLDDLMVRCDVLSRLGLPAFTVGRRELQVTGHGDGGFFCLHKDAAPSPDAPTSTRHVTFLYYFHRQPRRFTGGDLLLFDPPGAAGLGFTRIDPTDNALVFFQSNQVHTVTRIHCPSDDPFDGRWTVNGWLHPRLEH